jgi:NADPH:quinone reductase-like Zn-dependent oxidoreductase
VGSLNVLELYRFDRTISGVDTGHMTLTKAARILDVLRRGFESGALHAPRTLTFPLGEAAAAYKTVLSGASGAKVVLLP